MARKWSLPEEFAQLIEAHIKLDEFLANGCKEPGKLAVALSALLPAGNDPQWRDRERFSAAFQKLAGGKGQTPDAIFAQVDQEFADFAPVLKLPAPAKSLVQHWNDALVATA
jgi:hypothetical protein